MASTTVKLGTRTGSAAQSLLDVVNSRIARQQKVEDDRRDFTQRFILGMGEKGLIDPSSAMSFLSGQSDASSLKFRTGGFGPSAEELSALSTQFPGVNFAPRVTYGPGGEKSVSIGPEPSGETPESQSLRMEQLKEARLKQITERQKQEKEAKGFMGTGIGGIPIPETPPSQPGGVLHVDKHGNKAYLYPDGTAELILPDGSLKRIK